MLARLFWYHLRLAAVSLRRDLRLSVAMFVCLALGSGVWTAVVCHYLREYPARPPLSPALHQVELHHPRARALDRGTSAEHSSWHARTRVTYPEYEALAASGIPARQTGAIRAQVLLSPPANDAAGAAGAGAAATTGAATAAATTTTATPTGPAPRLCNARFVGADFFDMFAVGIGRGRAFSRAEDAEGAAVAVIGRRLDEGLFDGGDAVGRTLTLEGRTFRIVGVVADDQPYRPEWDIVWTGKDQDAVYLPFSWARVLAAWPEQAVLQSPLPDGADGLWRSDAVFVAYWAELPAPESRAAYARYVAQRFGARSSTAGAAASLPSPATRPAPVLRAYPEWRAAFPAPETDIVFFTIVLALVLVSAAFTTARLLLAKGLARQDELGIHRALGATRGALFARQMLEAALIALPAALAGVLHALALHAFYNRMVLENDIPVRLSALAAVAGIVPAFAVGMLAAAYPSWRMSQTDPTVYLERI